MEVNKEINPTEWRKVEKKKNPKFAEFIMKVEVERFSYNNFLQDFKFKKIVVKIAMDVWLNSWRKEKKNIYRYFTNTFLEFKVLKKVIITEMFNVDFHDFSWFIKFWTFQLSSYICVCCVFIKP